jgi:glycosyltransferase involved in cell wall biosynthesis
MKILFCSQSRLRKEIGGSKPLIELAEEMQGLGWECDTVSPFDLPGVRDEGVALRNYPANLRRHLLTHAAEYDVIDYDHQYLPYQRSEFPASPLFVARSVLLLHHLRHIRIPESRRLKARVGALLKGRVRAQEREEAVRRAEITASQADLINVTNDRDRAELIRSGIARDKIVVFPFGLSRQRRMLFDAVSSEPPQSPVVAFVGTFDYRKGACEFPQIVRAVVAAVPDVTFRLLGTAGRFQTRDEVLSHFPASLRERLDVRPRFTPEELPEMLTFCSVGIFPSYLEGFPFGVLEMLAASVPVIAYDCPGPSMMVDPECLVPSGDAHEMSARVVTLLKDTVRLRQERLAARLRSQPFNWSRIAHETSEAYRCCLNRRKWL